MIAVSPVLPSYPELREIDIAKNQDQYLTLPAVPIDRPEGKTIVFCHKLSFRERLSVLVSGRIWFEQLTFGHPLQPHRATTEEPDPNAER